MAMFKSCTTFSFRASEFPVLPSNVTHTNKTRSSHWNPTQATLTSNFHLPMRSFEDKNRLKMELKASLLVAQQVKAKLMSWDEHIMLIGHTVNCFGGKIKVIGNTGSNSTREAIHATEQGFAVGMHAALHINPYYGKTSIDGMISHFNTVLSVGPTIHRWHVLSRSGQDIPPHVIQSLAKSTSLAGVKECVGNDRIKQYTNDGIVVWSGNDDQCHDARWGYGATGVISVTSNLVPGLMRELMFSGKNPELNSKSRL